MTTTYDPGHDQYLDEADTRVELARAFDVCSDCRRCVTLCGSFTTLFTLLDDPSTADAGTMTPAQQDEVVSECSQCKLCAVGCPHLVTDDGDVNLDMPRLMLRATAMQADAGLLSQRTKATARLAGRTPAVGRIASAIAPVVNRVVDAEPGSLPRRVAAKLTGVSAVRVLAPYAKERFSTWFAQRPKILLGSPQGQVTIMPTCAVEYHEPGLGQDLVKVYERNGIECDVTAAGCCGAPSLQAGDIERFAEIADRNVEQLANEIRSGTDVVVPQPSCAYVLKRDYVDHVTSDERRADAELVAAHTFDAAEYLMRLHRADDTVLDTTFEGEVSRSVTCHVACHSRAQGAGFASRDLLQLTGTRVRTVQGCAGANGVWGISAEHDEASSAMASAVAGRIEATGVPVVVGDCHRANTAIAAQLDGDVVHPIEALARAYGIQRDH